MAILSGYSYDIFISYRHNDNRSGWVTEFVKALQEELAATIKEPVSVYFDTNPHDGLLETHNVDKSLEGKLKCLIFIPIISQTYCDQKGFAWQHEFVAFNKLAREDQFGRDIKLSNGNVASRILPVKIHDLDGQDQTSIENEIGGVLRAIEFIFKSPGVNRPLRAIEDHPGANLNRTIYRDQVNKVANAIKEIFSGIVQKDDLKISTQTQPKKTERTSFERFKEELLRRNVLRVGAMYLLASLAILQAARMLISVTGAAENLYSVALVILVILFPVAIVMGWYYERSPSGFVRYGTAQSMENSFTSFQRKPLTGDLSILMLLVLTLSLYFLSTREIQKVNNSASVNPLKVSVLLEHEPADVAISHDGSKIAYNTLEDGKLIYVRNLNEDFSRPLASTEGGSAPFFSPDGKMVGYFKGGYLFRTSVDRSDPLGIAEVSTDGIDGGAYWDVPDTIVYSADLGAKLYKVSVNEGKAISVPMEGNFFNPSVVPGSEYILGSDENSSIIALSVKTGISKMIMPNGGWQPKYVEPGYLVYALQGRLLATPFDREAMRVTGIPVPVLSKVQTYGMTYHANFSLAKNGTLVYSSATPNDKVKFVWTNEHGTVVDSLSLPANFYGAFSLSPDGSKLAYGLNGPNSDVWIFDLVSGRNQKLTEGGVNQYPIWSPDGLWVTYSSYSDGKWDLYRKNLNSTQPGEKLTSSGKVKRPGTWSPDGKLLTFYEMVEGEGDNMFMLSLDDKKITAPWQNTKTGDRQPKFSPNGKFVCYQSANTGLNSLFVEPFPATGERWQISSNGIDAIWSGSGDKIFYRSGGQNSFFHVELKYDKGFSASSPKEMFSGPYIDVFDKSFDVSKDGKKFLVLKAVNVNEKNNHLEVILNWPAELKRVVKREND